MAEWLKLGQGCDLEGNQKHEGDIVTIIGTSLESGRGPGYSQVYNIYDVAKVILLYPQDLLTVSSGKKITTFHSKFHMSAIIFELMGRIPAFQCSVQYCICTDCRF